MNLTLKRNKYREDGVFSTLSAGGYMADCLEHAYESGTDVYRPKLPPGVYTCIRGTHQLHNGIPFETFEVTGITDHRGILFHVGNVNRDSDGCILVGTSTVNASQHANTTLMITNSKAAFAKFMELQKGVDKFTLTVIA